METESSSYTNNLSRSRSNPEGSDDMGPLTPVTRDTNGGYRTPPYNPNKACMICAKELSWYTRRRKCTLCHAVTCHECASRKVIPGEVVCRTCELNRNLERELSESPAGSRQSPDTDVVVIPEDNPVEAESRRNRIRNEFYANLNIKIFEARGLIASDMNMMGKMTSSDPFCIMTLSVDQTRRTTRVISSSLNPVWGQEFDIGVKTPTQNLEISVYDHDVTGKDEFLGKVEIPIDRVPNGSTIAGWMSLHFETDEGTILPAGQVYVALCLDYKIRSELRAYVRASVFTPPPRKIVLDINALYGPLMLISDIVWTRTFEPVLNFFMSIFFWENFFLSLFATLLFIPIGLNVAYAPSATCFFLSAVMIYNWVGKVYQSLVEPGAVKKPVSKLSKIPGGKLMTNVGKGIASVTMLDKIVPMGGKKAEKKSESIADSEQQSLGTLVSKAMLICPGWLKEMMASYQPLVRMLADYVTIAYDILHTTHSHSGLFFVFLIAAGVICLLVPFNILFASIGAFALFSMSPIMRIVLGFVTYFTRNSKWTEPVKFGMAIDFDPSKISKTAEKAYSKTRSLQTRSTVYMQKGTTPI